MSEIRGMGLIVKIQAELSKYCREVNWGEPSSAALFHLAAINQAAAELVRSVDTRWCPDSYRKARKYLGIAERRATAEFSDEVTE